MSTSLGSTAAVAASKTAEKRPMILVGGPSSYAPDSKLAEKNGHMMGCSYYRDYAKILREKGIPAYESTQAPYRSNWDQACELFANIKGGRVDYGKAHSEKYGHSRFGRTFPGLYPKWDDSHSIDLFGLSMSAETLQILSSLLAWGDADERKASPDDCSILFQGGHGKMVNSVSTIVGINNGTTFADLCFHLIDQMTRGHEKIMDIASTLCGVIGLACQGIDLSAYLDTMFDQWDLQPQEGETNIHYIARCISESNIWKCRDVCWWDMTTWGAKEIQKEHPSNPDAYYFAYPLSPVFRTTAVPSRNPTAPNWFSLR
ncbi:MAG: hypothetical protein PUC71_03825 [Oscillospiraceae bacterium]|nr:hypothetical protein [Oscillospiraceae bacterium]